MVSSPSTNQNPALVCVIFQNLVVDLRQEAPYFFAARVKDDSDYGVNRTEKKKERYVGEPLAKLWLFASVSGTDTTSTNEIKYKKQLVGSIDLCLFGFIQIPTRFSHRYT